MQRSNNIYTENRYVAEYGRLANILHVRDVSGDTVYDVTSDTLQNTSDDIPIEKYSYSYNSDGELFQKMRRTFDSTGAIDQTVESNFVYDLHGRIKTESITSPGNYQHVRAYEYDNAGNRTAIHKPDGSSEYFYNSQHQLTYNAEGNRRYKYDDLGNLTQSWVDANNNQSFDDTEEGSIYNWSLLGQLNHVEVRSASGGEIVSTTVAYTYNLSGNGQLESRIVNGSTSTYHWEGYVPYLQEEDGASEYAYFNQPSLVGSNICRFDLGANDQLDGSDNTVYYLYDEAGNVNIILSSIGSILHRFDQDIWGNELNNTFTNSQAISQHRTGKLFDKLTGLYYNSARWYDPTIGRFISESPIAPLSEEEFAYCTNDPINSFDNSGFVKRHNGDSFQLIREIFDIFEFDLSIGAQGFYRIKNPLFQIKGEFDVGSIHIGLDESSFYNKTKQGIGVEFSSFRYIEGGFNASIGAYREKPGFPGYRTCNQYYDSRWRVVRGGRFRRNETIPEFLENAPLQLELKLSAFDVNVIGNPSNGDVDFKFGGGAAVIFGGEGYLNISEFFDLRDYIISLFK